MYKIIEELPNHQGSPFDLWESDSEMNAAVMDAIEISQIDSWGPPSQPNTQLSFNETDDVTSQQGKPTHNEPEGPYNTNEEMSDAISLIIPPKLKEGWENVLTR